jgi:GNAT superfamily N-acetyltransferase
MELVKSNLAGIRPLRALHLREIDAQVRYDAQHARGWADSYLLVAEGAPVGYGSLKAGERGERDTVFEWYLLPGVRRRSCELFARLIAEAGATHIECQSNDAALSALLFEFAHGIAADVILFEAGASTALAPAGAVFRRRRKRDTIFEHHLEPIGDFVVERGGEVVATGGFGTHYNEPFADLHMEVHEPHRRQGAGAYLVQELIAECYAAGRVPAARCDLANQVSRATLTKGGMALCGFMLSGEIGSTWRVAVA